MLSSGAERAGNTDHIVKCLLQERAGVVGRVELLTSTAMLDFLLPHMLDWLPMLDMLEFLLLEKGLPDLPRVLGTLPPSWNIDSRSD